jgi:3',5'-cyclic AMP phosphodiesterase CpdA
MATSSWLLSCASLALLLAVACSAPAPPEQIRLALTGTKGEMVVGWATLSKTGSKVQYTCAGCGQWVVEGSASYYYMPWIPLYVSPQIHFATLRHLNASTVYSYRVGDESGGWSDFYQFTTEPEIAPTPDRPIRVMSIGDEGATADSKEVLAAMMTADQKLHFDLLVHAGDISYANGVQEIWDVWGRLTQPLATHLPWMVAVGNHELIDLLLPFLNRFSMPAKQSGGSFGNLYYSWDYGNIHFIALDSESFEYFQMSPQHIWLKQDLHNVNRTKTPWVVAFWHSPWYCSNTVHQWDGWLMKESFEDLFYHYKVDLVLQGHVHAYERTHPVYKGNVTADAPVYITNGVGGNGEGLYKHWQQPPPAWAAKSVSDYGFGYFEVYNATHLHWTMKRSSDSAVIDEAWLVRPAIRR